MKLKTWKKQSIFVFNSNINIAAKILGWRPDLVLPRDQMWSLAPLGAPLRIERMAMGTYELEVTTPTEGVVITCLYAHK